MPRKLDWTFSNRAMSILACDASTMELNIAFSDSVSPASVHSV